MSTSFATFLSFSPILDRYPLHLKPDQIVPFLKELPFRIYFLKENNTVPISFWFCIVTSG
jgi:hypothetical protein